MAQAHGAAIPPTPLLGPATAASSVLHTPTKGAGASHSSGASAQGDAAARGGGAGSSSGGHGHGHSKEDLVPGAALRAREAELKKLGAELERRAKQARGGPYLCAPTPGRRAPAASSAGGLHCTAPPHAGTRAVSVPWPRMETK